MATIRFKKDLIDYSFKLRRLWAMAEDQVLNPAIYDGAAVIIDSIKDDLRNVIVDDRRFVPKGTEMRLGPTSEQKEQLLDSYGISPMQTDSKGFRNVKVGVDGYNRIVSITWPQGQPQALVARSIESGTSFMYPHPFVKEAVRKNRIKAIAAMEKRVDKEIKKIME